VNKHLGQHLARLFITILLMSCGLCGTSLGVATTLARYVLYPEGIPDPDTALRFKLGIFLFCAGCLFLYLALYVSWIRPRRKPIGTE